jgi:hypothetical protein
MSTRPLTHRRPPRAPALLALAAVSALTFAALSAAAPDAALPHADAQALRAQVFVTQAAIPRGLTEKALVGFARSHAARTMAETDEADLTTRRWLANMVVSFNVPPGDLEYHALFYDVTDGGRNFVDDMAIYLNGRDQRTYVQRLNLARPRFRPNRRMELVITVRRAEVGSTRFETRGEEPRRTGQFDFSVDDTRVRD